MTIQLNADNNLIIHESFDEKIRGILTGGLSRFSDHITRLEVHLSDENGGKTGHNDKRCLLEARLEGKQPIAVSADADTHELSVKMATDKLKHSLETITGRDRNH